MPAARRQRVLAVVSRFKWQHIDYLRALADPVDLTVAWAGEGHAGAAARGGREGLRTIPLGTIQDSGLGEVRARLADAIAAAQPDVVHVMYYNHERLTLLVRELVGSRVVVLFECRDPLTTLSGASPGSPPWQLERAALEASDVQLFVSEALRAYLERVHGLTLAPTSLIVPHAFAGRNAGPPADKLSTRDGRAHIALVGTADPHPDQGRYYGHIVRRLVAQGLVVHSHFHAHPEADEVYRGLAAELRDYHAHPTVSFRDGTRLSALVSRYDLMGVFHELEAPRHNESATLAVCMPTKAVCGWLHGAVPVVCFPHYGGLVEVIRELGTGFVVERWDDLARIAADRGAIGHATAACLTHRERFTNEWQARRIAAFLADGRAP